MLKKFESILALYEDFRSHPGVLSGGNGFFDYQAPSSIHSDITCFAYGIRTTMSCIDISDRGAQSTVTLQPRDLSRRFYLKLTACLFRWECCTCGIEIAVNGVNAYENSREFFENVNLGWPTVYIPLDSNLLRAGENTITLTQTSGETALLVSVMDLLSLPAFTVGQQTGFRSVARENEPFTLSFFTDGEALTVQSIQGCSVLSVTEAQPETFVRLSAWGDAPSCIVSIGGKETAALLPHIVPASEDVCLVGTDSDDHRHDDSDETDRILEIFTNTAMGDFWQARPQYRRNYHDLSSRDTWQQRIARLRNFGIRISQADAAGVMPWLDTLCGDGYIGRHFHEAYLYFCAALERSEELTKQLRINFPRVRASESFGETKALFVEALKDMYASCQDNPGMTSVGSPSLLTVYEAKAGFERVTIEPVSNIALLIGAVRGAKPKKWGAHVPTDWYFGEPNDTVKSRKFLLAMQMLYLSGADYVYAENSLFKTNAFSREDWEDPFCVECRRYQRDFFAYKQANPRKGDLQKDLAVIYGNHEFFLWHTDDRIAELPENNDWDQKLWGKWEDNRHHKLWRAIDAWLPLAENQHSRKNVLNLDLFSGTPYGAVDVIPYENAYTPYKSVALLGWNTCEAGFAQKLRSYVEAGGQAFVSRCHFNTTDRCDMPFVYDEAQIALLLGNEEKTAFAYHEDGSTAIWQIPMGKGILYYGTYEDYTCTPERMEATKAVLRAMGEAAAQAVCDNPNIFFTLRETEGGQRILDALNVCPNGKEEAYTIRLSDGRTVTGTSAPGQIQTHCL